jgi:hypothetical protein
MRSLGAILLVVLVLLAGTAAALWWFPAPLLGAALRLGGLETGRFADVRLSTGSLEIDDLQIGAPPEHRVARLLIGYRLGDLLLRGRLAGVEITGLELHGRLVDGRIELAGLPSTPGGGGEATLLPWPERIVLQDALIRLDTPWGELRAPLAAEAMLDGSTAGFRLEMTGGELINDAGRLQADLGMTGSAPLAGSPTLGDLSARGRLELAAERFALPEVAGGIDGKAAAAFQLAAGRLEARLESGALQVAELAPALAALRAPLPPPWRIELADAARPLRLGGALAGDRIDLDLDGALRLTAGAATVGLDLAARLAGDARGRLTGLGGRARVELSALRWPAAALEVGSLELAGEGTPDAWQGTLDLELAGSAEPTAELSLRGAGLRHRLGLSLAGRQLTVSAREDGALALERLAWQGKGTAGPLAFALPPQDEPLLAATVGAAGGVSWQQRLRATGQGFDFTAQAGAAPLRGRAEIGELTLALDGDQSALRGGRLALAGGRLRLPEAQLTLAGIASEVALAADGLAPGQSIPLTVETIGHDATPAWFAPLSLRGTLRPEPAALEFEARLNGPAGALALTLSGRHTIASGRGRAEVELAPLTFAPGGLQPRMLAPASASALSEVAGTLGLRGSIGWGGGAEVAADLSLLLEELAFTSGPARFSRVNGVVELDRLWPPSTPPGQQLAIGLVDLGLPLTRGVVAFQPAGARPRTCAGGCSRSPRRSCPRTGARCPPVRSETRPDPPPRPNP